MYSLKMFGLLLRLYLLLFLCSLTAASNHCEILSPGKNETDSIRLLLQAFDDLNNQLDYLTMKKDVAVIFLGLTGSGKTTLVQFLTAGYDSMQSHEVAPGQFIFGGNEKIGSDTITSKTTYPDLVRDSDTGMVLCDMPGFQDTRSPTLELIAALSTAQVIENSDNVKLVLVVPHTSLMIGKYRNEFIQILKDTVNMVRHVDVYKNSFYLVASKTENSIIWSNQGPKVIPDTTIIEGIAKFLNETRYSLINHKNSEDELNKLYFNIEKKHIDVIDFLLTNEMGKYSRISVFRAPKQEGFIKDDPMLENERKTIREMLLTNKGVAQMSKDFGYSISSRAKLHAQALYFHLMSYPASLSEYIFQYFHDDYHNLNFANITSIEKRKEKLIRLKFQLTSLLSNLGESKDAAQFINAVSMFATLMDNGCTFNFSLLNKMVSLAKQLDVFTDNRQDLSYGWILPLHRLENYFNEYTLSYVFLKDVIRVITSFEYQKQLRNTPSYQHSDEIDLEGGKEKFMDFLKSIELHDQYHDVRLDEELIKVLNTLIILAQQPYNYTCNNGILFVSGFVILLSDLDVQYWCEDFDSLVIQAGHTIHVDTDLDVKGVSLYIYSPFWRIRGSRTINVSGKNNYILPFQNLSSGENGANGVNGNPSGSFTGVGNVFENEESLTIYANGEDGQDGQDGANGMNGYNGQNSGYNDKSSNLILILFNKFDNVATSKGYMGLSGTNSGSGGWGGLGGTAGDVSLRSVNNQVLDATIVANYGKDGKKGKDGKPGIGGKGACNIEVRDKSYFIFFIPLPFGGRNKYHTDKCAPDGWNGTVNSPSTVPQYAIVKKENYLCETLNQYIDSYDNTYRYSYDDVVDGFLSRVIDLTGC